MLGDNWVGKDNCTETFFEDIQGRNGYKKMIEASTDRHPLPSYHDDNNVLVSDMLTLTLHSSLLYCTLILS